MPPFEKRRSKARNPVKIARLDFQRGVRSLWFRIRSWALLPHNLCAHNVEVPNRLANGPNSLPGEHSLVGETQPFIN